MLARTLHMRTGADFRHTIRRGSKAAGRTLVTHVVTGTDGPTSVGFVVSKAVGTAVDRNRVKRRLRHLMRERVAELGPGGRIVVRALPPAREASSAVLAKDLDRTLTRALGR